MYDDLRRLARARLRAKGRNVLLDTSALVHESYLRFAGAARLELNDRVHFMRWAGRVMRSVIVDLARRQLTLAQPGSTSGGLLLGRSLYSSRPAGEVAAQPWEIVSATPAGARVRLRVAAPEGARKVVLVGDFTEPALRDEIAAALGRPADAILCDAAPKLTGIRDVDQGAIEELWQAALALARSLLKPGGFMIVKGFPGQEGDLFRKELRRAFAEVHEVRPEGKRATSKEFYWVAAGSRMRAENAGS